ncbi:hypothetical protein ACIBF7_43010 [Nonomuraea sp. NPDC050478]|uniref:hypothetical protein n=1 Tax=Nonomuraea sp. NPDC050478 TaxID=3364365 RepID=UPI0037A3833C
MDKGISVFAVYLVITSLASAVVGLAAIANLIGHDYPKKQADRLRVPRSWTLPLGLMLAAGSLGLLAGFAVPSAGPARRRRPRVVLPRRVLRSFAGS